MGLFDRFRKKKEEEEPIKPELTDLEKPYGSDSEIYKGLERVVFLNPGKFERSVGETMESAAKKAEEFERQKDMLRAGVWYHTAARLAVRDGNVEKAKEYFTKAEQIQGIKYSILNNLEKIVPEGQKYCADRLKKDKPTR